MALIKRFRNLQSEENTGFSERSDDSAGRFFSRTTQNANVIKKGVGILDRYNWYHTLLGMKRGKFGLLMIAIYATINLVFAGIYYLIGVENIGGIQSTTPVADYFKLFFFSTQTFTTVGFGHIHPIGTAANFVTTIEAFIGLMSFALATGLFYGRFSRPQAFIRFSNKAVIAPFKDGTALMFRIAPYKNNTLSEIKAEVTLALQVEENGKLTNKFFDLPLQFDELNSLALSWTIVHPITETSPLYGFTEEDLKNTRMEVLPFIKAFDEVFCNTVMARYSYISREMVWGAKFKMMFHPDNKKSKTVLDLGKLNDLEPVPMPKPIATAAN
jgi:inward rectifier potassium channel